MLLKIAVCDDEAIHRLIIRDKLDKFAISNDVDYELDEFCTSEELLKIKNIYDTSIFRYSAGKWSKQYRNWQTTNSGWIGCYHYFNNLF